MPELITDPTDKQKHESQKLFTHIKNALEIAEDSGTVYRDLTLRATRFHLVQTLDALQHDLNEIAKAQEGQG